MSDVTVGEAVQLDADDPVRQLLGEAMAELQAKCSPAEYAGLAIVAIRRAPDGYVGSMESASTIENPLMFFRLVALTAANAEMRARRDAEEAQP